MRIIEKMIIQNTSGLSMRIAAELVHLASQYGSHITIRNKGGPADVRSILGLMALAATNGSELELTFDGNDAGEARKAFKDYFTSGFLMPALKTT